MTYPPNVGICLAGLIPTGIRHFLSNTIFVHNYREYEMKRLSTGGNIEANALLLT